MFVCLSAFYRPHNICPLCGAASESESRSRRGRPRASGQACTARARARMPYNFSTKKSYADAFQKQNRTHAHAVVYVTAEIFKKGKKKTNMPLPKFSLQFAFSWSVYFSNRTESYSSQIEFAGPHGITENQATYLHCGGEAKRPCILPLQGCASQAVVQFAPLLIIDVFLNQVTSVVLISLYFIHFMTIYIVIRPLIQSHL